MEKKLLIKRGVKANLPTLSTGELGLCTDTNELYVGSSSGNTLVNNFTASEKTKLAGVASGANNTTVENVLTSSSTTNALSAYQGKVLNTSIGAKANLASPTFTGVPKAPTAVAGTNNTQIATTEFVKNTISENINATGYESIAIGTDAVAIGQYSVSLGNKADSDSDYSIAIGYNAVSDGEYSISIGKGSWSDWSGATAIGTNSYAYDCSTALGFSARAAGTSAIAIGNSVTAVENTCKIGDSYVTTFYRGAGTSSAWNTTSDENLKENIESADLSICYDDVKKLEIARYSYKKEIEDFEDNMRIGFIAQNLETIYPKSVKETTLTLPVIDEDGNRVKEISNNEKTITTTLEDLDNNDEVKNVVYAKMLTGNLVEVTYNEEKDVMNEVLAKTIDTTQLLPMAIGALKKAMEKIEDLEARVLELEN